MNNNLIAGHFNLVGLFCPAIKLLFILLCTYISPQDQFAFFLKPMWLQWQCKDYGDSSHSRADVLPILYSHCRSCVHVPLTCLFLLPAAPNSSASSADTCDAGNETCGCNHSQKGQGKDCHKHLQIWACKCVTGTFEKW